MFNRVKFIQICLTGFSYHCGVYQSSVYLGIISSKYQQTFQKIPRKIIVKISKHSRPTLSMKFFVLIQSDHEKTVKLKKQQNRNKKVEIDQQFFLMFTVFSFNFSAVFLNLERN